MPSPITTTQRPTLITHPQPTTHPFFFGTIRPQFVQATMSTVPQSAPHISGHRSSQEPPHHGINDGSGDSCGNHSYAQVDEDGKAVPRDASLTEILISKGVKAANFLSAIVSLGEGRILFAVF